MPRHSFAYQAPGGGSLRGWLVGLGLILAVLTGVFTFFLGVMGWLVLGALRALASPFRSKRAGSQRSGPRWTVRAERPGREAGVGRRVERMASSGPVRHTPEAASPASAPSVPPKSLGEVQDVDFEEIR